MTHLRIGLASILTAALLAACGGGDTAIPGSGAPAGAPTSKGNFTAVVSFGDSLSDVGSYAPATSLTGNGQPPYFGGKFTTNIDGNLGTVWVENLARTVLGTPPGVPAITPAEVGFAGQSVKCPIAAAAPTLANTCTGYSQGGSRVTDPNGIGHVTAAGGAAALTVPVVTQIANHLVRFGSFKASDLVFVWAGNNDAFVQIAAFGAAAAQIQANAAAGKISADEANAQLFTAQTAAQYAMKAAAQQLTGYIRDQILAKGGKYVAVVTAVDAAVTPGGKALPAALQPVLTTLVDTFNLWLRDGLTDQPVQWIDSTAMFKDLLGNLAANGFVNATVPACDADKIKVITGGAVTDGSSLFCNATAGAPYNGLRAGASSSSWVFADGNHPTTGGHKYISDRFAAQLKAFGWL